MDTLWYTGYSLPGFVQLGKDYDTTYLYIPQSKYIEVKVFWRPRP